MAEKLAKHPWQGLSRRILQGLVRLDLVAGQVKEKSELDPGLALVSSDEGLLVSTEQQFRYFSKNRAGQIYMGASIQKPPTKGSLFDKVGSGIYRIKSNNLQLLFTTPSPSQCPQDLRLLRLRRKPLQFRFSHAQAQPGPLRLTRKRRALRSARRFRLILALLMNVASCVE